MQDFDPDLNHFNAIYPDINEDNQYKYYDYNSLDADISKNRLDLSIFNMNICSLSI